MTKSIGYPRRKFRSSHLGQKLLYLNGDFFYYEVNGDTLAVLLDSRKINDNDTIHYKTVLADFAIGGNDSTSTITFINAYKVVPVFSDKDYQQKAIKEFEKRVIRKID